MACLYILLGQLLKEAGLITGMAHRTKWFSLNQNGITVAILPQFTHYEAIA